jgi:hypothetical protein
MTVQFRVGPRCLAFATRAALAVALVSLGLISHAFAQDLYWEFRGVDLDQYCAAKNHPNGAIYKTSGWYCSVPGRFSLDTPVPQVPWNWSSLSVQEACKQQFGTESTWRLSGDEHDIRCVLKTDTRPQVGFEVYTYLDLPSFCAHAQNNGKLFGYGTDRYGTTHAICWGDQGRTWHKIEEVCQYKYGTTDRYLPSGAERSGFSGGLCLKRIGF